MQLVSAAEPAAWSTTVAMANPVVSTLAGNGTLPLTGLSDFLCVAWLA